MVLVDDPLRSVHALPGVVANNDLRAEFSLRGAAFDQIGIYVDGVRTGGFVHMLSDSGTTDQLSLSIVNQDTIASAALTPGVAPVAAGGLTAGVLELETREGNRERVTVHGSTGFLTTSGVVEGPLPGRERIVAAVAGRTTRADYVQQVVDRATTARTTPDENDLQFGDVHAQGGVRPDRRASRSASPLLAGVFTNEQGGADHAEAAAGPELRGSRALGQLAALGELAVHAGLARLRAGPAVQRRQHLSRAERRTASPSTDNGASRHRHPRRRDVPGVVPPPGAAPASTRSRRRSRRGPRSSTSAGAAAPAGRVLRAPHRDVVVRRGPLVARRPADGDRRRARRSHRRGDRSCRRGCAWRCALGGGWLRARRRRRAGAGAAAARAASGCSATPRCARRAASKWTPGFEKAMSARMTLTIDLYRRHDRDQLFALAEPRLENGKVTGVHASVSELARRPRPRRRGRRSGATARAA